MKLKFDKNLDYQLNAIKSIVDIFYNLNSSNNNNINIQTNILNDDFTYSNPLINEEWWNEIALNNIQKIQAKNNLKTTQWIYKNDVTFDVEMETGTGKTYVYLRTIFELYEKYNFKKFIILVPSKAIKEGLNKTLEITYDHFKMLYPSITYNWYNYNSDNINVLYDFSQNYNLEIMIMNIQQINKYNDELIDKNNNIYKYYDRLQGQRPIDIIKNIKPIIFIDEPQSVASGIKSIEAIKKLNPLFIVRYSATFHKRNNEMLMYKLDPIDAYNLKLVKQIQVISLNTSEIIDNLIELIDINQKNKTIKLKLNIIQKNKGKITKILTLKLNDNLFNKTNNIEYTNYIIEEINFQDKYVLFSNGKKYYLNALSNDGIGNEFKKTQIKTTIKTHLDLQLKLLPKNIKVLSLFFIDKVKYYRIYNNDKNNDGIYKKYFEESLYDLLSSEKEKYKPILKNLTINKYINKCHDGYFSIDKSSNKFIDSLKNGDSAKDESTYNKIMRDKEKLLSFDEPLSFIFSHTSLKEGWDNPNIFQICTLNETSSIIKKRQEIGRGLRLCVDQSGNRIHDEKINILSIITNSSYEQFVTSLQKEMIEDGIQIGIIKPNHFINNEIDEKLSSKIFNCLKSHNFINNDNFVNNKTFDKDEITNLLKGNFNLSEQNYEYIFQELEKYIHKKYHLINANKKIFNDINKEVIYSKEFYNFWNLIKTKTQYKFKFDTDKFIDNVLKQFNDIKDEIYNSKFIIQKSILNFSHTIGIDFKKNNIDSEYYINNENNINWYQIINEIRLATNLTNKTIIQILKSNIVNESINKNKNTAIERLIKIIKNEKMKLIIDGIEYTKTNNYYDLSELKNNYDFEYEKNDLIYEIEDKNKYPYKYLKCDSKIEKNFALDSDHSDLINKFIKLPKWFYIDTPLGKYNPDWAIFLETNQIKIAETKGTNDELDIRQNELLKIKCGKKHFESINRDIEYKKITKLIELFNNK